MKQILYSILIIAQGFVQMGMSQEVVDANSDADGKKFKFSDVAFFHRSTQGNLHEFTPTGQEDLEKWTEMISVNHYPNSKDGEGLAKVAEAVLMTYQKNKARVLKTDSVPRTKAKPAEHLIVAIFGKPEFLEATFTRFKIHDGIALSTHYSHRIYGKNVGDKMSKWLQENGPTIEKNLMKWNAIPNPKPPK